VIFPDEQSSARNEIRRLKLATRDTALNLAVVLEKGLAARNAVAEAKAFAPVVGSG
jgi:hypothetical protein